MVSLHHPREIEGQTFLLAEKLDDYVSAQVAAAEYRAEGWLCRIEPVIHDMLYYIWVGPERQRMPRTLPGEKIKRHKNRLIVFEKKSKVRASA